MKNKQLKIIFVTLCLSALLLVTLTGCSQSATATATQAAQQTPVVVESNTVIAAGHLVPVTSSWLSFQTSGRVESVLVSEGAAVTKGQALVKLEGSERAQAALQAAQSALFLAQQTLNDAKNSGSLKAAAELKLATAQTAYNTALGNYYNRNDTQGNAQQIALYDAKVTLAQDKVDHLQTRLNGMAELSDSDTAKAQTIADLNQAKLDLDKAEKLRNYFNESPDNLDVQTLTAKLDVAKSALADAQRDYDRLKDGVSPESLAALQANADAAQSQADNAQWAFDQLVLTAPYAGVFVQCDLTVGTFVPAGQPAALVADFSQWSIETDDLDEIGVAQIDVSKPVAITADALPGQTFTGKVDGVLQNYINKNGDILYTAKVKLDKGDPKLRWGMTMQLEFQK
ncbi:MAG: HlyD family secretion protein [Anaerolineaceae bacterium]